jgi:hypothetical protein
MNGTMYGNKWIVEDQRDMPQQHIRMRYEGVERVFEENVIFTNEIS